MKISKVGKMTLQAWNKHPRYISSCGGTRSGKTYSILQIFVVLLSKEEARQAAPTVNSIVSETLPHLKRGCIRDFKSIMDEAGIWDDNKWNKTESIYTFGNGSILEFFSADNAGKVHGPSRNRLFLNECQNIPHEIARQLFIRTSGVIVLDYNPTHEFWANTTYEARPDCIAIHSTYKDNDYLSPAQVAEIESNKADKNWWRVYGEGKVGMLDGLIYPDFEQVDELPDIGRDIYGMDFGFQADPTAIVRLRADKGRKILYLDEVCYRRHMLNADIVAALKAAGVSPTDPIYADCAEPKSIEEIRGAGFNIKPSNKSAPTRSERLKFQLLWMQGWRIVVTKRSTNLIKELRNYTWRKDKDGNVMNEPIDMYNHCFTGDTLITTARGDVRIDEVHEGEMALTSDGWRKVLKVFDNGCREILHIRINFSTFVVEICGTPTHRIKTTKGWKELQQIKAGDVLTLSRCLMVRNTTNTLGSVTTLEAQRRCTARCGRTIMARSLKGVKYTTKTEIQQITTYQTSNVYRRSNTQPCTTTNHRLEQRHPNAWPCSTKYAHSPKSGTVATRVGSGTGCMARKYSKIAPFERNGVSVAARCLRSNLSSSRSIAATSARARRGETRGSIMRPGCVPSAARSSQRTNIARLLVVQQTAVKSIQILSRDRKQIYDMMIQGKHEYFANGLLVHNCLDASRYAAFTEYGTRAQAGKYFFV